MPKFSFQWENPANVAPRPMPVVMAHYLPWFTTEGSAWPLPQGDAATIPVMPDIADWRHWTEPSPGYLRSHLHWPEIGRYDSRDPAVIAWQIETAQSAGIDGFVINWYGKNSVENVITRHFLRGLAHWNQTHPQQSFGYQICLDSQCLLPNEGKAPVPLVEDLAYLRDHLIGTGHLHRDGRPVILCFSYSVNRTEWEEAASSVFAETGVDLLWSDPTPGAATQYLWVGPDAAASPQDDYAWPDPSDIGIHRARETYARWKSSREPHAYGMAGVWPGFNDSLVTWAWGCPSGSSRLRPRVMAPTVEEGNTYDLTWQAYLEALAEGGGKRLPLVQIVTWNDHAEATNIEPTKEFGTRYLEQTRKHISEARRLWKAPDQ